jgi:hypothetical protein
MLANTTGNNNTAFGRRALRLNLTGSGNVALGQGALDATTSDNNTAVGAGALEANTTGANNTAIGSAVVSGNFSGSLILGQGATATANNQAVFGSSGTNAGAVATETLVSDRSWSVRINGTAYKILLKS